MKTRGNPFWWVDRVFSSINQAIMFVGKDGNFLQGNKEAHDLFHSHADVWNEFMAVRSMKEQLETKSIIQFNGNRMEVKSIRINAELYCLIIKEKDLNIHAINLEGGAATFQEQKTLDIDNQWFIDKEAVHPILSHSYYDSLLDLPNDKYFNRKLHTALLEATHSGARLAVFYIDINYFKEINDTFGYDCGNKLLKACETKLKSQMTKNTFLARSRKDEFIILQRDIRDKNFTTKLAEQVIKEFEGPIRLEGKDIYLSLRIGISFFPENGQTTFELLKHANVAMNTIEKENRNHYKFFERSISEDFKKRLLMERDLRKALEEGQFELHYQPQKNLHTDKIVGMEALLRWNHPENGYIPPLEFIPLAEKTGLIVEIGEWVLREACVQNKKWQCSGFESLFVSVNLSAKQLYQKDLVSKIKIILEETELAPEYLELEITESMAMSNEQSVISTLKSLRDLGVMVSIDDFGTGYSSLKYLSLFPVTRLKIDKMFMKDTPSHNKAIVKSIILMCHSLNMKVIAEGVEKVEQYTFLKKEKCDEMQGYLFSKPLPPKEISQLLAV